MTQTTTRPKQFVWTAFQFLQEYHQQGLPFRPGSLRIRPSVNLRIPLLRVSLDQK